MWYRKEFKELELKEFYEIVQLRLETFVVEQTRIYNDLDAIDLRAAQEQVVGLYEKLGFQRVSEPFILASTPHVKMIYQK